jgi:hypothetical protein
MSEYSNNWSNYSYMNVNQPLCPQTELIRESLDRNESSGSSEPRYSARAHGTAGFFDQLPLSSTNFAMPGSLINISDDFNFHLAQIQDASGSGIQSLNTSITPDLWLRGQNPREVRLHRSINLDLG